jgi:hypothetical protein
MHDILPSRFFSILGRVYSMFYIITTLGSLLGVATNEKEALAEFARLGDDERAICAIAGDEKALGALLSLEDMVRLANQARAAGDPELQKFDTRAAVQKLVWNILEERYNPQVLKSRKNSSRSTTEDVRESAQWYCR